MVAHRALRARSISPVAGRTARQYNGLVTKKSSSRAVPTAVVCVSLAALGSCAPRDDAGSRYLDGPNLVRPADYREWPFIGAGLGLTYEEEAPPEGRPPTFTNVFVNPSGYRGFMDTGSWPDATVFVLEFRRSVTDAPPNAAGRFQGELIGLEAEVKDSRYEDGWAFFNFGGGSTLSDVAEPLAGDAVAGCVECHTENTALERTFVQFYPTLMDVAREKGTLKPGF